MRKKSFISLTLFAFVYVININAQNTYVEVIKNNTNQEIVLEQNKVLKLNMPSDLASAGYGWYVKSADKNIITQFGDWQFFQYDEGTTDEVTGGAGYQVIDFVGVSKGTTELELQYMRPWEENVPALETYKITVVCEGNYTGTEKPYYIPDVKQNDINYTPSKAYPASFDWVTQGIMTPVKDQGNCGSCWAQATCGVFEAVIKAKDGTTRDISEQWFVNCDKLGAMGSNNNGCTSGYFSGDEFVKVGCVYEADEPYKAVNGTCKASYTYHEKAGSWKKTAGLYVPAVDTVKKYLYYYGPLFVRMKCGVSNFQSYTGGIYTYNNTSTVDHAMVLTGWNDANQYWIIKNSWGTGWGESGYVRVKWGVSNVCWDPYYIFYKSTFNQTSVINNLNSPVTVSIYPNPAADEIFVKGTIAGQSDIQFLIADVLGKTVYSSETTFESGNFMKKISLANLPSGIYCIRIHTNSESQDVKRIFIKE
ncbi:MAG: C1 family peptidase [Bacteroidales bacterium]|nr:C1 family peptidase [Bacteroidales bacterium]